MDQYDTSSLYSVVLLTHIVEFGNELKSEENFVHTKIMSEKVQVQDLYWISTVQENDEETIIEYSKPGLDTMEKTYPLI